MHVMVTTETGQNPFSPSACCYLPYIHDVTPKEKARTQRESVQHTFF
jgi:hypothetical protein